MLFFASPALAVDVQMGSNGNLVFDPAEVTISAGESVHFVNNMLPPTMLLWKIVQTWS